MKYSYLTRLTGLLLAGFLFSCTPSKVNIDELIASHNYTEALNELHLRIQQQPKNPSLYLQRAEVSLQAAAHLPAGERYGLYTQSVEDLNTAGSNGAREYELAPVDSLMNSTWTKEHNAGLAASENGDAENLNLAAQHFANAIILRPDALNSYQNLAVVQFNLGEVDAAISTLMTALNFLENPPVSIYENLGYLYLEKGNPAQSIHYYELANKNVEEDINLAFGLVNAYIAEGNTAEATTLLEQLTQNNPENANLRNVYGTQLYNVTSSILDDLANAYEMGDSLLADQLELEAEGVGEEAEMQLQEAFKRDTLHSDYIESLAVFYNNLAGKYLSVAETAFDSHKNKYEQKALKLIDFAIDYYTKLEAIKPDDGAIKNQLNSLKNLKQNRIESRN